MKMKGISPLLAAVILVALTISVAFIVSSAISGMAQKQSATAEETAKASGAMLQVDLDSVSCNTTHVTMVARLVGTTSNATDVSVVIKDNSNTLRESSSVTPNTLVPGVNLITATLKGTAATGNIKYLGVSTGTPSIFAEYDADVFGNIGSCS